MHGERAAKAWTAATSLALVPVSLLLMSLGLAGWVYGGAALSLGIGLCAYAVTGVLDRRASSRWARRFFVCTLAYLTLLFAAIIAWAR